VACAREPAFALLLDPEFLARCIPGCEELSELEPGRLNLRLRAALGPIQGHFSGQVLLGEVVEPELLQLRVEGDSPLGRLSAHARLRLEERPGGFRLDYEGEAQLAGMLASLGAPILEAQARQRVPQLFESLAAELAREAGQR